PVPFAGGMRLPRGIGLLDGEVDLAVFLDGDHLDGDLVALVQVVADVPHVVPVDLRDVNQPGLASGELHECSEICDPNNRSLSDSSYLCQVTSSLMVRKSILGGLERIWQQVYFRFFRLPPSGASGVRPATPTRPG